MNEEQQAEALAKYLDALLAGEPLPEPIPDEIATLLALATDLEALTPKPDPAFTASLRESVLSGTSAAGGGATASGGWTLWSLLALGVVGLLGAGVVLLLVVGTFTWQIFRADDLPSPSPNPLPTEVEREQRQPASPSPRPATATAMPTPTSTPIPSPTPTITNTPVPTSPTATPVLDTLPPIIITVESTLDLSSAPGLVPGSSSSSGSDSNGGSRDGGSGSGGSGGGGNGGGSGGNDNDDDDG
jgi:uncharacterized membrane protein YgcG